jgi:hypothetical protein
VVKWCRKSVVKLGAEASSGARLVHGLVHDLSTRLGPAESFARETPLSPCSVCSSASKVSRAKLDASLNPGTYGRERQQLPVSKKNAA